MIENFSNKTARDIWQKNSARKLPEEYHERAKALLTIMHSVEDLKELEARAHPPAIRIHHLKGDRSGYLAIDINKISGWRITFKFKDGKFLDVAIEDYHQ